ncbi:MAG: DUF2283 domain-containing protein [Desulfurococcaceae archaeon]|uniref:DUF2283 domain-containing protein n=1 Tax=Staphylothermus marinus TaxID=2280 RepID=A0A7C4DB95_STAMA
MENEERTYIISDLEKLWLDYDRQNDILYINIGEEVEDADEEILIGGDIAVRIKDKKIISIMIMKFMEKLGLTIY